jgi:hypothetical protein
MEPENSLPYLQKPVTCPCPDPDQSSPCQPIPLLPNGLFPSGLPTKTLYAPALSHIRTTCPAHLILLDLINWIFGDEYRSWSSSLCSLLRSPVTSSLLGPSIVLSTLFPNTLSLRFFLNVSITNPRPVLYTPWAENSRSDIIAHIEATCDRRPSVFMSNPKSRSHGHKPCTFICRRGTSFLVKDEHILVKVVVRISIHIYKAFTLCMCTNTYLNNNYSFTYWQPLSVQALCIRLRLY